MSGSCEPNAEEGPAEHERPPQPQTPSRAEGDLVPRRGRLMGLDFGTRRIGIALCDEDQRIASPLENYSRSRPEVDALRLKTLAGEYRVVGVVVGLPLHMGGEEGQKAREARRFGACTDGWQVRHTVGISPITNEIPRLRTVRGALLVSRRFEAGL